MMDSRAIAARLTGRPQIPGAERAKSGGAGQVAGEASLKLARPAAMKLPAGSFQGGRKPRGRREAAWKTDARKAAFIEHWPTHSSRELVIMLAAMDGPALPKSAVMRVHQWAVSMRLPGKTAEQFRAVMLRGQSVHRGEAVALPPTPLPPPSTPGAARSTMPGRRRCVVTWAEALAWADRRDPDLVLRGSRADRLAQINELRGLEELGPFRLAEGEG